MSASLSPDQSAIPPAASRGAKVRIIPLGQSGMCTEHETSQRTLHSAIFLNVNTVKKEKQRGPRGLTATYSCVNATETQINTA